MKLISGPRCPSAFIGLAILSSLPSIISVSTSYDPYSATARCPMPCNDAATRATWGQYQNTNQLSNCNQTILLDLNLYNGVHSVTPQAAIRACSVQKSTELTRRQYFSYNRVSNSTRIASDAQSQISHIQTTRWLGQSSSDSADITAAALALADAVKSEEDGGQTILFAKSGQVIMGVYAGSQIQNKGLAEIIQQFAQRESGHKIDKMAAQLCSADSLGSQILGIFVDTAGRLSPVQAALRDWHNAKCLELGDETEAWQAVSIAMVPGTKITVGPDSGTTGNSNNVKRATCTYTQAVSGDGCWSLADRCKITQAQLVSYNNDPSLCSTQGSHIQVGQYFCCSAGTLPDFTPKPNADGTCKTHTIKSVDLCSTIAKANTMTVDDINARNKDTWGWIGCNNLIVGGVICLSKGSPPMPGAVANALCGPTVQGTQRPANMSTLADLNPCPLKACCNVWGQCGITKDFCHSSPADTGAPGTATPGSNGCIASCGSNITNNGAPPSSFKRIGYFEAWNGDRPCLHMKASQIDTTRYTHVHFSFGNMTDSFQVDVSGMQKAFDEFKAISGVKRILSFGGWSFSTDYDTFPIFRQGVTPAQRQTFANNVASFIVDQGLDGVDFDWEYPGAPDIPGVPPGSPEDGPNYLAFLKLVRAALPADMSIGIAAPASYWYLKGFPISDIASVVDYIVYMTYDLHGQWDYGNSFSTDGCPAGNCLRSHVNRTETEYSLAMVTKAGVPASKIVVGMALYGRSFQMTSPGCYGADCTYTGPESGATPGKCTNTSGYISNFEIRDIIASNSNVQQYSSDDGDILVYNDVQWVSWMTKKLYDDRVSWIRGLNFGGTSDWAIDLDADFGADDTASDGDTGSGPIYVNPDIYNDPDPTIQCYPPCTFILPPWVLPSPTTITMDPITVTYRETWETTVTISGGIVTTSAGSTTSTVITPSPITTQTIHVSNVIWNPASVSGGIPGGTTTPGGIPGGTTTPGGIPGGTATSGGIPGGTPTSGGIPGGTTSSTTLAGGFIWLTSSILPPPVTITQTRGSSTGAPIIWTYSPGPFPTPATTSPDEPGPPGPPGPPPPPPPGYPSSVSVGSGPPKPGCRPGQICGSPCLINCHGGPGCVFLCGCIGPFCPSGSSCVGPGCTDSGGDSGGGNPNDPDHPDDPSSCRKRTTASYCNVKCSVLNYPSSTTTICNDPDCTRTITACTATDSTSTTTVTLGCPAYTPYDDGSPNDKVPIIGDGGLGGYIIDPGNYDTMPASTKSTTKPLPPTPTTKPLPPTPTTKPLPPTTTSNPSPPHPGLEYHYDCAGSTLCNTLNVKFCDKAVNNMQRGNHIYTANSLLAISGNCWANTYGDGCKVVIEGDDPQYKKPCTITGDEMWEAYQNIRKIGGCSRCGHRYDSSLFAGDECRVTIDFMRGCDNRDGGLNVLSESKIAAGARE